MKIIYSFFILLFFSACKSDIPGNADNTLANTTDKADTISRKLFNSCEACHGKNAEGNLAFNAPALANQDTWYLVKQLLNFKNGIRGTAVQDSFGLTMSAIARSLSDSLAMAGLVNYIKTLPPVVTEASVKGDVQEGLSHYQMICGACHGPGAEGIEELGAPKLTGINDWYLERQLLNFKNGIRGTHPDDKAGIQMKQMANTLKDEKAVRDVVVYIQSLQQKSL